MSKRQWTKTEAKEWISKVNIGREKVGLKFCSACDYLGLSVSGAREIKVKRKQRKANG